jgi:hypothetical protein
MPQEFDFQPEQADSEFDFQPEPVTLSARRGGTQTAEMPKVTPPPSLYERLRSGVGRFLEQGPFDVSTPPSEYHPAKSPEVVRSPAEEQARDRLAEQTFQQAFSPEVIGNIAYPGAGTAAVGAKQLAFDKGKRVQGASKLISGAGEALTPFVGPAVLGGGAVPVATGLATSIAGEEAAGRTAKHFGASPEVEELARTAGSVIPMAAGTITGLVKPNIGFESTAEGTRASGTIFGGKAGVGVATTPEQVSIRGKAGPFQGEVKIPRGPKPAAAPALDTNVIEGKPITREEIAEAQEATNYAGPGRSQSIRRRQACGGSGRGTTRSAGSGT